MIERAHEAWLLKLSIQMETIERYIAAMPGADVVDVSEIKAALKREYNGAHGDVVGANTVARWVDVAPERIKAIATGETVPEFDPD